jgi:RNase P/RNase MRP subunit POP5
LLKRVKRRYLVIEIDSVESFDSKELMEAVWRAIEKLFGEYGASRTGLSLIEHDADRRRVVLRVLCDAVDAVRAALASITKINGKTVALHVLMVSGTLKALYKKLEN